MNHKNKLIVLEGIDGVGKTTVAQELKKRLRGLDIPVVLYESYEKKHPGFNPLKPLVKKMPVSGSHLFYLASAVYKSENIKKLLKKNWVICDRYFYSSIAHHKAKGSHLKILGLNLIKPDYGFLLKVKENARKMRIRSKTKITPMDRVAKTRTSFPGKMEKFLKKMDLVEIDNSGPLEKTIRDILSTVKKN